jgi:ABC-type sugar transport system permease subunit
LVRHVVLFAAIYLFIDAIALFSGAYVLLGGSGGTLNAGLLLVNYSYQKFSFGQFGLATAAGLSVLPVMLLLLWLLLIRSVSRRVG